MKRTEQEATDMHGRWWKDRHEGPKGYERVALRRKARRKMKQRRPSPRTTEDR